MVISISLVILASVSCSYAAPTPCLDEREQNLNPPPGRFVPQCTGAGYYNVEQFHGSTGYTWCVDPETGGRIQGTEVPPGGGRADCPKCLFEKSQALASSNGYTPQCHHKTGHYVVEQVSSYSPYAWCVDPDTGNRIQETLGTSTCPKCLHDKAEALLKLSEGAPPQTPIPQCNPQTGNFEKKQFSGSSGYSWCADEFSGVEIPGTALPPGSLEPPGYCGGGTFLGSGAEVRQAIEEAPQEEVELAKPKERTIESIEKEETTCGKESHWHPRTHPFCLRNYATRCNCMYSMKSAKSPCVVHYYFLCVPKMPALLFGFL